MNIEKKNLRYNILIMIIYIIGIIMLLKLFSLQIVHGKEYYETSSTRLTRETAIKAARGNILDRNGNVIASSENIYILELYRSKIDEHTLNNTILNIINVLEKNKDDYRDSFPIAINPVKFTIKDKTKISEWKKMNNIDENLSAKQIINKYKEKYNISNNKIEDVRKIIGVRYGIEKDGYSTMRPYVVSKDIGEKSVAIFEEQNSKFPGLSINASSKREYLMGNLASHIVRIYWTNKRGRTENKTSI